MTPLVLTTLSCVNALGTGLAATADGLRTNRLALIVGTSTSGVREGEYAFARRDPETGALPAEFRF